MATATLLPAATRPPARNHGTAAQRHAHPAGSNRHPTGRHRDPVGHGRPHRQPNAGPGRGGCPGLPAARVKADADEVIPLVCKAWKSAAVTEAISFRSMNARLEGVACTANGSSGLYTLVGCTGKMVTTYGGEARDWDLSSFVYQTLPEDGDGKCAGITMAVNLDIGRYWRMSTKIKRGLSAVVLLVIDGDPLKAAVAAPTGVTFSLTIYSAFAHTAPNMDAPHAASLFQSRVYNVTARTRRRPVAAHRREGRAHRSVGRGLRRHGERRLEHDHDLGRRRAGRGYAHARPVDANATPAGPTPRLGRRSRPRRPISSSPMAR